MLYCSHRDGSVSVWQRHARLLTYSCLGATRLLPPAPKFGTGALLLWGRGFCCCPHPLPTHSAAVPTWSCESLDALPARTDPLPASSVAAAAPLLAALAAGLWRGLGTLPDAAADMASDLTTQASIASGGRRPPGMARRVSSGPNELRSSLEVAGSSGSIDAARRSTEGGWGGGEAQGSGHSVLLMGTTSDGRVWQWQLPLLAGTLPESKPKELPLIPRPELLGAFGVAVFGLVAGGRVPPPFLST